MTNMKHVKPDTLPTRQCCKTVKYKPLFKRINSYANLTFQQLSNHGTSYLQVLLIWKMEANLSYLLKKRYFKL